MSEVAARIQPNGVGPRRPLHIQLLLDAEARVVSVNRSLAGKGFASISARGAEPVHPQLHPGCSGECRFHTIWQKAWASLQDRDMVEWEIDDSETERVWRLNLCKLLVPRTVEHDLREPHRLLTITDITRYRREYESLIEQQRTLVELLRANGLEADRVGDTGHDLLDGTASNSTVFPVEQPSFGRQLVLAQEYERRRIASELHDGIAQGIGFVKYKIEAGMAQVAKDHPEIDLSILDAAIDDIKNLVDEVRRVTSNLVPAIVEDFGIQVGLDWLCKQFADQNPEIAITHSAQIDESETPGIVKLAIFRVVQEALNNVVRHASATEVEVAVATTSTGGMRVSIADDGRGFAGREMSASRAPGERPKLGLQGMRLRVEASGGRFLVEPNADRGTRVLADWTNAALGSIR